MEIVVVSRHTEIAERFRRHVEGKLAKVGQLSPYAQRIDVEVTHEANPRLAERAERIELTVRAKGPVVRAEASASDRYAALDMATTKLLERLRRDRDRRKSHHKRAAPAATPAGGIAAAELLESLTASTPTPETSSGTPLEPGVAVEHQLGDSPVLIREKLHPSSPMSVDQALAEMENVGHPFYLFIDVETRQPAVVYRRHGWTYGVIRLDAAAHCTGSDGADGADRVERAETADRSAGADPERVGVTSPS